MQILKCIIVDDEPLPLELLGDYVSKTPFLQLAGSYTNPLQALTALQQQPVDLVFLDIQMPELSGIQFTQLAGPHTKIIFTTAYPGYALQGYELNVIDYLLKPISFERFLKAATRALQQAGAPPAAVTDQAAATTPLEKDVIFVKSGYRIVKIPLGDILYIESLKEYAAIHKAAEKILTIESMKRLEEVLPPAHFVRVHKSFIVAILQIDSIERNRIYIRKNVLPIGETYREAFFRALDSRKLL